MLLLPGHQHDLWHQYCADKLLTSQDLLYLSLVLILMYSVLLVWKKIFMVNTPLSQKEHYSGSLPHAACQDELLALHLAYIITELHSRKPLFSPGFYFSILCSFFKSFADFLKSATAISHFEHMQYLYFNVTQYQLPLLPSSFWSFLHKPFL